MTGQNKQWGALAKRRNQSPKDDAKEVGLDHTPSTDFDPQRKRGRPRNSWVRTNGEVAPLVPRQKSNPESSEMEESC